MVEFAKTLGYGLLYFILSPFLLVLLVLYAIFSLLVYLFHELSSIVLFFFGKNYKYDDEETLQLYELKEEYAKKKEEQANNQPQTIIQYVQYPPPGVVPPTNQNESGDKHE